MVSPCSRQTSTRRVASAASVEPQAAMPALPPNVPVPSERTGTLKPERPRSLYSMIQTPTDDFRRRAWHLANGPSMSRVLRKNDVVSPRIGLVADEAGFVLCPIDGFAVDE